MCAQRASAPVRLARLAAAVVLVGLAAVVAARLAGRRGRPPASPVEAPPAGRVAALQERVRQQEFKDGRAVADIRGESFFRGQDGRNHLKGSVEFVNLGPAGETVSRLSADEVVYDRGSLRFSVAGHVRIEAGGIVLEGDRFEYDKAAGLLETKSGGRFSSKTMTGSAPEIAYAEAADEVRLGGGFRVLVGEAGRTDRPLAISGTALVYARRERRGRVEGRGWLESAEFEAESASASFVASPDESSLESAVFEGAARIVFAAKRGAGEGRGEIAADRIAVGFLPDPFGPGSIQATGRSSLSFRSDADGAETILAPAARLSFDRVNGLWTWSASGGVRAEVTAAGRPGRALEGEEAVFDAARLLRVSGGSGRPAAADSAEARIEAPSISVATATGGILATGGVAGVLKSGEGRRTVGFFSPGEDAAFSSGTFELRPEISTSFLTGDVLVRQGTSSLRAGEIELAGETGRMSGGGGVAVELTETAPGEARARTVEIGGQDMAYRPDARTLILTSKAYVRLAGTGLRAGSVSAVIAREGRGVESLTAVKDVAVSKGRYVGRSESANYDAAADRITLTGHPVLTDEKGGSAKGAKLTFNLADDKIFIENEGSGRATTVVRS
jgi:lipopolysaccharide export system protein LptA